MKIVERTHPTTGKPLQQVDIFPFVAEDDDISLYRACLTVDLLDKTVYPNVNGYRMSLDEVAQYQAAFAKAVEILNPPITDDEPTGFMRPCEDCEGTGVKLNVWIGHLGICPTCDGDGIYRESEDASEPEPPEYDADLAERQHEATLYAIEIENDLKAYYAEHGDDAPEPLPAASFYGAVPIPVEEGWHKETDSLRQQLADSQANCIAAQNLARENIEHLAVARAAQDLLRGELVAVTAERDELKAARELWTALRREIWELVQQADFDNPLANELETLLK